jgi:hypothetical protein
VLCYVQDTARQHCNFPSTGLTTLATQPSTPPIRPSGPVTPADSAQPLRRGPAASTAFPRPRTIQGDSPQCDCGFESHSARQTLYQPRIMLSVKQNWQGETQALGENLSVSLRPPQIPYDLTRTVMLTFRDCNRLLHYNCSACIVTCRAPAN